MSAIRYVGAVAIFVFLLEICARADDAWSEGAPLFGRYDQSALMTVDRFGITGRPNARYAKWKMNGLGFRGPELRDGSQIVLCIGASETFGLYEPEGLEFPRQLERKLNEYAGSHLSYQVVNAGLPGQSVGSFARRAVLIARRLHPSAAVIYPSLAIYIDPPPEQFVPGRNRFPPAMQWRLAHKLEAVFSDRIPPAIRTPLERALIEIRVWQRPTFDRVPDANVERFRRDLSRLLDLLQGEKVAVLLITHATRFGPEPHPDDARMLTAWRTLYPQLREGGFLDMENRLNQVIRSEAFRRKLPMADAAAWLHGPENFTEFVHFTPQGAEALATAVSREILESAGAK